MTEQEVYDLLKAHGAIVDDIHVVYVTRPWRHGAVFIDCEVVLRQQKLRSQVCAAMASIIGDQTIDVVIGPAEGGNYLAEGVAEALMLVTGRRVAWIRTEKSQSGFRIRTEAMRWIGGSRVLVVEDIVNQGGSVGSVIKLILALGGIPVGIVCIWNRGDVTAEKLQVSPFISLIARPCESWSDEECPLCLSDVPIDERYGHGREYMEWKRSSDASA